MVFRHEYPGGVWVDLEQPSPEEIREIAREFNIGERLETELLFPTPSPLVARDEHMMLLVLHFPDHEREDGAAKTQEIDFVVGKHFIITVRYEVVVPVHHLKRLLETERLVESTMDLRTDALLEILFAHLYTATRDHVSSLAATLAHAERDMLTGHERNAVERVADIGRAFLHLDAAFANQESALSRFLSLLSEQEFFGKHFTERAERVLAERGQIANLVQTHRAIATELRETNLALMGARQNDIMKTLTTVNIIFLPLGLIAWTFAMRTEGMPIVDDPNGFWIVLGIMLAVALFLTLFFMKKRWL